MNVPDPPSSKYRSSRTETLLQPVESYFNRRKKILKGLENKRSKGTRFGIRMGIEIE
jgi:hypothetical protein